MFKARWRSDKNKIKAVFRLQFQATQIPQPGWEGLVVSLVPTEAGKPTAKSEKAVVVDGGCCWEKAMFETVRLSREPKSGKINEKTYRFLVSATESPKARLLGEAAFDFASYAFVVKPSTISLPLKASNSNPVLHVTVQRMQDTVEGRESEENEISCQTRTLQNQFTNCDEVSDKGYNMSAVFNSAEDSALSNSQAQSKFPSSRPACLHVESIGNLVKSTSFDAILASESDTGSEQYTPKESGLKIDDAYRDSTSFLSPLGNNDGSQKPTTNSYNLVTEYGDHRRSTTECSITSAPDASSDGSTNSSEDTGLRERLKGSDISSEKLRKEIVALARQVEVSELELQALRKQIVKERRQGEDLSKELCILRDERDTLKKKCELLKASEFNVGMERVNSFQFSGEEMKQELNHEKNLNANLHLQLQKTQESNMELVLAVKDLEELLEQRSREAPCTCCNQISVNPAANEDSLQIRHVNESSPVHKKEVSKELSETISEHEDDEELEVLAKEQDDVEAECSLEQKITDLNAEIELYKKDRDDIEMQMEQLALDFEIIKQENHDLCLKLEQSQLREQLKMQYECSAHTSIINDLEGHVDNLEIELEKRIESFEADLTCITKAKIEQEQRAIRAEEALRKTKLNNANTAEHLQKEIKRLSMQMSSAFDANENLAKQAFAEATKLRLQKDHLEVSLEKANEELASIKYQYKIQLHELLRQIDLKMEDVDQLNLKLKNKSEALENQKKSDYTMQKALLEEISVLKVAVEKFSQENGKLSEQVKQEHNLIAEVEQEKSWEKTALDVQLASLTEEAEKSMEELSNLRHLKDEKEMLITTLSSDTEALEVQYNGLKKSLFDNELQKESLMKEVLQLRDTLQKKEEAISLFEKKLKENTTRVLHGSKDVANLRDKIKNLEDELKMKDAALEALKHSYSKKNNLGSRGEELENGLVKLEQNGSQLCKDAMDIDNIPKTINVAQENNGTQHLLQSEINDKTSICNRNGTNNLICSSVYSPKIKPSLTDSENHPSSSDESLHEVAALKEKNESMEIELKEMQERYLEISLKFAEVEGERQQLVMTIRSLKNAMKN